MSNYFDTTETIATTNTATATDITTETTAINTNTIERQLVKELEPCKESPFVKDVRVLGAIGVVELKEPMNMKVVQPQLVREGVWLRPFGKLLYTMPPFIIQKHELRKITKAMVSIATRRTIR